MGAALRTDPSLVRVGPLSGVTHCPLASALRKRLHRRGVPCDFPVVYSTERTDMLPDDARGAAEAGIIDRGRQRRPMGSLPTLTGIFGLTAANTAIRMLANP